MANQDQHTPTQEPISDAAFMRQVEAERLNLEHRRVNQEDTNTYLEQWKLDVVDRRQTQMNLSRSSVEMASLAFRSIFLLNGGAMIAIPTFGKLVDKISPEELSSALMWFGFGLCLVTLAMVTAYLSLSNRAGAWREAMEVSAERLNKGRTSQKEHDESKDDEEKAETERVRLEGRSDSFEVLSLGFALAGLGAFILGTYFAASMLSG